MDAFEKGWRTRFGPTPPLGHLLRAQFAERWFRVHTLANSKRYAGSDEEGEEIFRRQQEVGNVVLGTAQPCWIVVPQWHGEGPALPPGDPFADLNLVTAFACTPDEVEVTFWVRRVEWDPTRFRRVLRSVADDAARALWMSDAGEVVAPYDGGIDVIASSPERMLELRRRFAAWLSPHPQGL